MRHLETHRRIGAVGAYLATQQIRARADERDEAHHELLPDRIDRRIRDLCEQLLEVVVEDLRPVRQDRQRRVVAHRARGFLAVRPHRREHDLQVFLRVAERLLAIEQRRFGRIGRRRLRHRFEGEPALRDPVAIRLLGGERALQLLVVHDAPGLEIDQQHPSRLQAPLLDDLRLGDVEHADFGRHHDEVVVRDDEARRTQAVAIERCADLPAIGEGHRRGAVPGFHQRRVVFVERATVLVHQRIPGPRLGNHHHHRVRERIAAHDEQFERVVERGRIRLAFVDQRKELLQVVAEHLRRGRAFAGANPVEVAAQRVDLAVVTDEAERMREIPRRERVRREALVDHRQRRHHRFVGEVEIEAADLMGEQHALVDDRARRERRDVELLAVAERQRLDRVPCPLADDVQLAFERILAARLAAAADEHLADDRFDLLRAFGEAFTIRGYIAPAEQNLPFCGNRALDFLLAGHA